VAKINPSHYEKRDKRYSGISNNSGCIFHPYGAAYRRPADRAIINLLNSKKMLDGNFSVTHNGINHNEIPSDKGGIISQIEDLKRIQKASVNPRMKPFYNSRMEVLESELAKKIRQ
jgi:hypothetical protein